MSLVVDIAPTKTINRVSMAVPVKIENRTAGLGIEIQACGHWLQGRVGY